MIKIKLDLVQVEKLIPLFSILTVLLICSWWVYSINRSGADRGLDFSVFYIAGKTWAIGQSPYDRGEYIKQYNIFESKTAQKDIVERSVFVGVPTLAPYVTLISRLNWAAARVVHEWLNFLAWAGVVYFSHYIVRRKVGVKKIHYYSLVCFGFGSVYSSVVACIVMGQTGIFALLGGLGLVYSWRENKIFLGVFFIILASFKPQVSFLLLLYVLLRGWWRPFVLSAAVLILCFVFYEYPAGLNMFWARFSHDLLAYAQWGFNSDIRNRIGAMGLIAYFINDPLIAQLLCVALAVCAVVGLCGLASFNFHRRGIVRLNSESELLWINHVFTILIISPLLMPFYVYDLVTAPACLILTSILRCSKTKLIAFISIALLARPGAGVRPDMPIIGSLSAYFPQILVISTSLIFLTLLIFELKCRALNPRASPKVHGSL